MKTRFPAYIILDIPEPFASEIIRLRSRYDSFRARLPAEITVFGSTGTRHIPEGQEVDFLITEIDRAIRTIGRVDFRFIRIRPFPNSDDSFFYLEPDNKATFAGTHEIIRDTVRFNYERGGGDFMAHCTIGKVRKPDLPRIREEALPAGLISLRKLSLIQFNPQEAQVEWLHSWELS